MPDIEFNCPNCEQTLEAPEEMAGQAIECPACNEQIAVPGVAGEDAEGDAECPNCGEPIEADAVLCVQCGYHIKLGRQIDTDVE